MEVCGRVSGYGRSFEKKKKKNSFFSCEKRSYDCAIYKLRKGRNLKIYINEPQVFLTTINEIIIVNQPQAKLNEAHIICETLNLYGIKQLKRNWMPLWKKRTKDLVDLPPRKFVVGCVNGYTRSRLIDGSIEWYKDRIVAKGLRIEIYGFFL